MNLKKISLLLLILLLSGILSAEKSNSDLMTKDDFKLFVEMINQRFDDVNRRFDDVNKRFNTVFWIMGLGFSALAFFSLFLYRLTEKRFEQIDKRFEQVDSLLFLLVKAHKDEIGDRAIDLAMGRLELKDITDEMTKEIQDNIKNKNAIFIENIIDQLLPILDEKIEERFADLKTD